MRENLIPFWAIPVFTLCAVNCAFSANEEPFIPADTTSPRATLQSFLDGCNRVSQFSKTIRHLDRQNPAYRPIARKVLDCLDSSQIPDYAQQHLSVEIAICLKEILDRVEIPPLEEIPDTEAIQKAGGPDKLPRWQIPGTRIVIARVEEGPHKSEYLFTAETLSRAKQEYLDFQFVPYRTTGPKVSQGLHDWYMNAPGNPAIAVLVDQFPQWMRELLWSVSVWKWLGLLLSILAAVFLLKWTFRGLRQPTPSKPSWRHLGVILLLRVFAVLIPLLVKHIAWDFLTLRGTPLYVLSFSANLLALIFGLLLLSEIINRVAERIIDSPRISSQGLDAQFVRIIARISLVIIAIILFLEGGRYLGIPLTTLIASAGITGLAVALAAQEMLKNIFGSVMIMLDQPYKTGERILVKGHDGIVEEVGLRSTKIRTYHSNHLVTITNDEMARSDIENLARRKSIYQTIELLVPIDTPYQQVEQALAILQAKLTGSEGLDPEDPPFVFFDQFEPAGFRLQAHFWFANTDFRSWKLLNSKLHLELFQALEEAGIAFSLPFRHSYWKQDDLQGPLDVRLLSEASAKE